MKTATLFNKEERRLAEAIGGLNYTNPFTPKRLEQERAILGPNAASSYAVWHNQDGKRLVNRNISPIFKVCDELVKKLLSRLQTLKKPHKTQRLRSRRQLPPLSATRKHTSRPMLLIVKPSAKPTKPPMPFRKLKKS